MTLKEFKEIIEMSGEYKVEVIEGHSAQTVVFVFNSKGNTMCKFWGNSNFALDTIYMDNDEFLKEHWDTIFEFAKTPIEYRYPVKKYYVKLDTPEFLDKQNLFLNKVNCEWNDAKIKYTLDTNFQSSNYQTQFTLEEIEEIIPKEDKDKFKLISVEED